MLQHQTLWHLHPFSFSYNSTYTLQTKSIWITVTPLCISQGSFKQLPWDPMDLVRHLHYVTVSMFSCVFSKPSVTNSWKCFCKRLHFLYSEIGKWNLTNLLEWEPIHSGRLHLYPRLRLRLNWYNVFFGVYSHRTTVNMKGNNRRRKCNRSM